MKRSFKLTGLQTKNANTETPIEGYDLQHQVALTDTRDGGSTVLVDADDEEIAEFLFDDDTFWMGTIGELPQLLQNEAAPGSRGFDDGLIEIPTSLSFGSDERGVLKNVVIKLFSVFKPKGKITGTVVRAAAEKLDAKLQPAPGLYSVHADFSTTQITNKLKESKKINY